MKRTAFAVLGVLGLALASCGTAPTAATTQAAPTLTAPPSATPPPSPTPAVTATEPSLQGAPYPGAPLPTERNDWFSGSGACAVCHSRMTDESGRDVSIDTAWRASIKANAARDPYFQASVRSEVEALPDRQAAIEDSCATCHAPMARTSEQAQGQAATLLGEGLLSAANPLSALALDGVSCTLCHQIRESNLGPSSYDGKYAIDTSAAQGGRQLFGPFSVDAAQAQIMEAASGFLPIQGTHVARSELCATCHTLYTPVVGAGGQVVSQLPEQVPYLEWYYSDYRNAKTCQDCHMPEAQGGVKISTMSTSLRSPFTQHTFLGGNVYMLRMLQAFGQELGVTASGEQLQRSIDATLAQLQTNTAKVTLEKVALAGSSVTAEVKIENLAGHKFPSSFPSRRAWIHFKVTDATGKVLFESGAAAPDGSITGNDNDADAGQYELHYDSINRPDQVQIYEAILKDGEGRVTTSVMRAAGYLKDNRLLPAGFEKAAPYEDIAVRGGAVDDETFVGGGDTVLYVAGVAGGQGPYLVTAELLYQSIGFRWAENLRARQGAEIQRFLDYYAGVANDPVVVGSATAEAK